MTGKFAGDIVEEGPADLIFSSPKHPYTDALIKSLPTARKKSSPKTQLRAVAGQVPDLSDPPKGCRFHPRCVYAMNICKIENPEMTSVEHEDVMVPKQWMNVSCFLYSNRPTTTT